MSDIYDDLEWALADAGRRFAEWYMERERIRRLNDDIDGTEWSVLYSTPTEPTD